MVLGFLPLLRVLSVSLDIPPASPSALTDLPVGLVSLKLGHVAGAAASTDH